MQLVGRHSVVDMRKLFEYLYRRMLEATGYFAPGSCPGAGVDIFQTQKTRATEAAAGAFALLAAAHEAELAKACGCRCRRVGTH